MAHKNHSIDGFVPRRQNNNLGDTAARQSSSQNGADFKSRRPREMAQQAQGTRSVSSGTIGLSRSDIDESLRDIDTQNPPTTKRKSKKGLRGFSHLTKKQIAKRVTIVLAALLLIIGGWIAYRAFSASGNVFKGNLLGLVQTKPLKEDANGRSNILLLGTSEDDPGHPGGMLTDSMMIVSINQKDKSVSMVSIPRDLYVKYGQACDSGYEGKINVYFMCTETGKTPENEQTRLANSQKFVGDIFGMDIQYGVHVNNSVIKDAVNAVGGIEVDIEGNGPVPAGVKPGSILDRNFDWRCQYKCNLVKYEPGVHKLDGKHALFLAMARGDAVPTYGLADSNFDREKNQQKIIIALKQKAASSGTLTDIGKVTGLIDAFGNNLRTNFETSEIRTLANLGTDIEPGNIKTISLYGDENPIMTSGNYGGASVVMPSAGIFDYSELRSFLNQKFSKNPVTRENAAVDVLNATGVAGVAQTSADKLTEAGFVVGSVANAPAGKYAAIEVYQVGEGNPATKAKLESTYNVTVKTTSPPALPIADAKFIVIIGKQPAQN